MNFNLILLSLVVLFLNQDVYAQRLVNTDCKCKLDLKVDNPSVPWAVGLQNDDPTYFCAGTIINHNWVLTSASCVASFKTPDDLAKLKLRVEFSKLGDPGYKPTTYHAKQIVIDPRFLDGVLDTVGDIAIIEVTDPIAFNSGVQPACFGKYWKIDGQYDQFHKLYIAGYGTFADPTKPFKYRGSFLNVAGDLHRRHHFDHFNHVDHADHVHHSEHKDHVEHKDHKNHKDHDHHLIYTAPPKAADGVIVPDNGDGIMAVNDATGNSKVVGVVSFKTDYDDGHSEIGYSYIPFYIGSIKKLMLDNSNPDSSDYCVLH